MYSLWIASLSSLVSLPLELTYTLLFPLELTYTLLAVRVLVVLTFGVLTSARLLVYIHGVCTLELMHVSLPVLPSAPVCRGRKLRAVSEVNEPLSNVVYPAWVSFHRAAGVSLVINIPNFDLVTEMIV